ncbi:SDR family NAD(P)-dependent oxidoreductase [Nocardia suismassiliense]|uniref:SDR family NAD(P)-dependent oxidoreductase n=1 Tax=Nocardia suismassiliense TaxID=2077092 RepID=UPI000D1E8732|nr:SDR family NAD(P)-dependent oxidoreductase [Nocardia suismassiliense]
MSASSPATRTVLVTGADSRLGFATARLLIADGATVIAHVLEKDRADETMERLQSEPGLGRVRLVHADFTRLAEVDELGRTLASELPRLDALLNVASIAAPQRRTHTDDGHELTFQVDYLAPRRLTMALAPAVAAAQGRVVTVTSKLHAGGNIDYSDLDRNRAIYTPLAIYAQAKLALTMFSRSLSETGPEGLTSVSVHPADFEIDLPQLRSHRTASVEEAAALLVEFSTAATPVVNGGYYEGFERATPAALVRNSRARTRLAVWTSQFEHTA